MKKLIALLLLAALVATVFAGCGKSEDKTKDSFTFISWLTAESLDPVSGTTTDKSINHALYDTLVAMDKDGNIIPMLAESWTESEDGMSMTFKLREDVTFHNGDKLTADDVIYSLDTMLEKPVYYTYLDYFGTYEKTGDYEVCFHKNVPYANLLVTLAEASYILPKNYHSADPEGFEKAPVGCGPYKFVSRGADSSVTMEAYDGYYGDAPGFRTVVVKPALEPANMVIALETREADLISNLPAAQAAMVEANKDLTLVTSNGWSTYTVFLMQEPLRSDLNLRKAIFHGISRENAIKLGNEGVGVPAENMFAARLEGDYAGKMSGFVGYDEALAKDYLAKSNYDGSPIKLTIFANSQLAESIQADLRKIGIKVELEQLDMNSWYEKLLNGEQQMSAFEFGTDMLTLESVLQNLKSSDPTYGSNMAITPEMDAVINQLPSTTDNAAREELALQAQQMLYDQADIVPLFDVVFNYSYGPAVTYDYPVSAPTYIFYLAKVMPAE